MLRCSCRGAVYCGVRCAPLLLPSRCQRAAWRLHRPLCPPVALAEVAGRGLGLLATRAIRPAAVVVREQPLLVFAGRRLDRFLETFARLPAASKEALLALYEPGMEGRLEEELEEAMEQAFTSSDSRMIRAGLRAWRILWTNGVAVGEEGAEQVKAVYPTVARMNHSCRPSAVFGLEEGGRTMVITACRGVARGEELLVNYIGTEGLLAAREERRRLLAASWGFECRCEVCSKEGEEAARNEEVRRRLREYREEVSRWVSPDPAHVARALALSLERVALMEELGAEVAAALPLALMEAYGQARVVQFYGGAPAVAPGELEDKAGRAAAALGPTTRALVRAARQEAEDLIAGWADAVKK